MNCQIPVVSIIIPTYNQADLLQVALQSVLNQTFQDWEVIVIDNYSEDNTKEIVESIHDTRIKHVFFSNKGIIAASRNHGIFLARSDIIAFLDSDDVWYPSKLSTCIDYINDGNDAVCHGLWIRKEGILKNKLIPIIPPQNMFKTLLFKGNTVIATSAVVLKMQCFIRFGIFSEDPDVITAEDYELWLRLSKNNINWGFIPEVLGEYTIHRKNASGNIRRQMLAEENIVLKFFKENDSPTLDERISQRKRKMMLVFRAGIRVWQSGNYSGSLPYFIQGISRIFR
jgi:glycosyltransferase involved in cell wall biosynthesis